MKIKPNILVFLPLLLRCNIAKGADVFMLESLHSEWKNRHRKCLKATGDKERPKLVDCDPNKSNQQWIVDDIEKSQFRPISKPLRCLAINLVKMKECKDVNEDGHDKQIWEYDPSTLWLRVISKDLCMDSRSLSMSPCVYSDGSLWKLLRPDEYEENDRDDNDDDDDDDDGDGKIDQTAYRLDLDGENEFCLSAANLSIKSKIKMKHCDDPKQKRKNIFVLDQNNKTFRPYYDQGLCIEVSKVVEGKSLRLNKCRDDEKRKRQQWKWNMEAYDDPIKPSIRRDLCIAHTTGGDRSGPACGCDGCNTQPCAGDKIKLFDAETKCKDPENQWNFRRVDPEDL